jgi:ribosomal protein S12 methylthiotransferase
MKKNGDRIKVALVSLGCSKNQVDSEVMLGLLKEDGFELASDPEKAEVIIVNTCGFIDAAKEESIDTLIELGKLKKKGAGKILIAAGCLAQRYGNELLSELKELDAVVGTGDFPEIARLCRKLTKGSEKRSGPEVLVSQPAFLYDVGTPRLRTGPRHWAYVKISEGCNYRCSFCSIPSFRGDIKSRTADSIVGEVERLAIEGVKEINLIAQSLTSYGLDWKKQDELPGLLKRLTKVSGIRWIRLFYAYPTDLTDDLIDLIAAEEKICSYVDLPLQHIDDEILKKMRRKGDSKLIRSLLEKLKSRIPHLFMRTTFIVGFPGETETQFKELLNFVDEGWFNRIGVFNYSHEEGTPAYEFSDSVLQDEKDERRNRLTSAQEEISMSKNQALIGSVREAMVEGRDRESRELFGRLEGQAPEIDGMVSLEGDGKPGDFVEVEITGANELDLSGRILRTSYRGS